MFFIVALFAGLAGLLQAQAPRPSGHADLMVKNARIHTVDPARPEAAMLAVKDGKVLAVGDDLQALVGPKTRVIDGQGGAVVPGLIDSHVHLQGLGDILETFDLRHVKSVAEVAARVRQAAAQRPAGEWIRGRAWDQTNWGGQFPSAKDLDAASPQHPVLLTRVDGHAGWANSQAMQLAGITAATPDPPGGKIVKDAAGQPTGVLIDRAQGLVSRRIPRPTDEQVERRLRRAAQECVRLGLTGVHDAGIDAQVLKAYRALIARNEMPLRIYAMIGGEGALWKEALERGPEVGDRLTVRAIKLVADGAMGSRGAAFWQSYTDDAGNTGLLMLSKEDIARISKAAVEKGFQVCTHAIGDKANRTALDGYGLALGDRTDRRFRIEHAQIVSLPDFALFAKHGVIASVQATHATSDMRWVEKRLGPDRLGGAYAWRRFLDNGVRIANGSDFPVESANPLWGFYASITRQDHEGAPREGFLPKQRLTRQEALKSWTLDGAYAAFEEDRKGSLTPGKLADFVLLSRDIMTVEPADVLKTQVVMTVVGGEMVHQSARP